MVSSIEGVGGEVIQFFLCLGIILVGCLLWLSTRVRNAEEPFFRTVYVLERRVRETEPSGSSVPIVDRANESVHSSTNMNDEQGAVVACPTIVSNEDVAGATSSHSERGAQCSANDSGSGNDKDASESPAGSHRSTNPAKIESTTSKLEDRVTDECESKNIKVRLKYTNDDSREVNGILHEKLVDFKRRNFPEEMSANKLIRLIFNGRMLRDDNTSLQNYGLFNDCVVHCLIVNERPSQPVNADQQEQPQSYSMNNAGQPPTPEWHLNKMFWFIIFTSLSVLWYCRFQFATLFTFTSTSFLVALTAVFLCSMFGTLYGVFVPFNATE